MWRALPGLVFLLLIAFMLVILYDRGTRPSGQSLVGKPAPKLYMSALDEAQPVPDPKALRKDGLLLINFFASWCTPCLAEHPLLLELSKNKNLAILGVAWGDNRKKVSAWLDEHGNPYTAVGLDTMSASALAFGVRGVPETFLIGRDGTVLFTYRGPLTPPIIAKEILPLLQ